MVEVALVQARRAYVKVPREGPGGERDAIKEERGLEADARGGQRWQRRPCACVVGRALCEPLLYGRTAAYG